VTIRRVDEDTLPGRSQQRLGVVTLTGVVDADYQIRVIRKIRLDPNQPVMWIDTIFQRVNATSMTNNPSPSGPSRRSRTRRFLRPRSWQSIYGSTGYVQLARGLPASFSNTNGLISFTRDLAADRHLDSTPIQLVWVGTNYAMRIDAPRMAGMTKTNYANSGCNTVIYTNHGTDAPYVELECFGPLTALPVGQSTSYTTTYTLYNRTKPIQKPRPAKSWLSRR